jgi:7,8-dihydro-6-hydroxymethylpterin-pyrophosphokinase
VKVPHEVLIGLVAYSSTDHIVLKTITSKLREIINIKKISSIYSVQGKPDKFDSVHDLRCEDSFQGLSVSLRGNTQLSPEEVIQKFDIIINNAPSRIRHEIKIYLLVYEDKTKMSPNLTLPYADLHTRPELIMPAADLWGEYMHPILHSSLNRLSKNYQLESWGDFYAQGDIL